MWSVFGECLDFDYSIRLADELFDYAYSRCIFGQGKRDMLDEVNLTNIPVPIFSLPNREQPNPLISL